MITIRPKNYKPPGEGGAQQDPAFEAAEPIQPEMQADPEPEPHPTQLLLEQLLGDRFELLRPLAVGGMARLFLLRHRLHDGLLVAKVLHPGLADRPELVAAFLREARHVNHLAGHPAIVPVSELIASDELHVLLLPYVDGEDLDHLLKRRAKLTRDEALTLLTQLTSLLIHAEETGIVHGDIAPGNIRLDRFGQYKLLDFGISRALDVPAEATPGLATAGTPAYNSPEQVRGQPIDHRSDLYSLGAVLVECLTGHPLFEAATLEELAEKHLTGQWSLPDDLRSDQALCALIQQLLQVEPAGRLGSASQLLIALAGLGYELQTGVPTQAGAALLPPRSRRRRLETSVNQAASSA